MKPDEIRAIRKSVGVNCKKFGKLIGVSGRTVENYEQGRRKPNKAVVMNIKRIKLLNEKGALRI